MKPSGLAAIALVGACVSASVAADATSPVDYTQRNAPFAPAGSVTPEKKTPELNSAVQEKRVAPPTVEKKVAPLADRRAPVDVKETREKQVREKNSRRPETVEQPKSRFDHRPAAISTGADTTKPPTVAKYQDSLSAASASNIARFPAMDRATTAKINRFVFKKNPAEPPAGIGNSPVTPAAGGSALPK